MNYLNEQQQYNVQDGTKVLALYLGSVQVKGTIQGSRAKFGTGKQYTLILDNDLFLPWCENARYKAGDTIGVENKFIVAELSSIDDYYIDRNNSKFHSAKAP